jgi:hypothetical protein
MLGRRKDLGQRPAGQKVAFSIRYKELPPHHLSFFPALFRLVLRAISRMGSAFVGSSAVCRRLPPLVSNGAAPAPFRRGAPGQALRS